MNARERPGRVSRSLRARRDYRTKGLLHSFAQKNTFVAFLRFIHFANSQLFLLRKKSRVRVTLGQFHRKTTHIGWFFCGGPAYTFSKPENPAELIDDLVLLYTKLVNLGMEYRNGKVYLADLEEKDA